jgi:hypothetical protein
MLQMKALKKELRNRVLGDPDAYDDQYDYSHYRYVYVCTVCMKWYSAVQCEQGKVPRWGWVI